ncbi:MAG: hypothetical protein ACI9DC_000769 [Gammaproteobacteria bacterium]|jgi:hypothetical protein
MQFLFRAPAFAAAILAAVVGGSSFSVAEHVFAASSAAAPGNSSKARTITIPRGQRRDFGAAPDSPEGALSAPLAAAVELTFGEGLGSGAWGVEQSTALQVIASSGDPRVAWLVSDLMRIVSSRELMLLLAQTASQLLGAQITPHNAWGEVTDRLIAWNVPAPPGYLAWKRNIYTLIVPEWERIFAPGNIDWRHVSWGGVAIDDRPFAETDKPCNCIPAADNPKVSDVSGATWLKDDNVVFGLEVNGEFRAYPRRIMEVREMVNDTLGGRHLGIPYCTLCGSAQAYLTDRMPDGVERPVLRTSGLLIRSNKVMYDVNTFSVFDTFRGQAVTGPLAGKGIVLKQIGMVVTTWGEWKAAHPQTTVLVEDLALGRDFDFRNNRDAEGPIFPIGDVDPRLPVQEDVIGVVTASGTPVAFHLGTAREVLARGEEVAVENVHLVLDGGGVRAVDAKGKDLGGHQAFWFAWSQFHPGTKLWPDIEGN